MFGTLIVKAIKSYAAIKIKDPETKRKWEINGQRLKKYKGGDFVRLLQIQCYITSAAGKQPNLNS